MQAVVHGVNPVGNAPQQVRTNGNYALLVSYTSTAGVAFAAGSTSSDSIPVSATADKQAEIAYNLQFNGTSWDRFKKPNATARLLSSVASTNGALIRTGPADLFKIRGFNTAAAARYLKIYSKATAPTVGTDVPIATYYLAPTAAFEIDFGVPMYIALGLGYAITGAAPDADTTAIVAGDIVCLNFNYA